MSKLHFIRPGSGGRTFCGRDRQRVQYTISLQVFRVWRQEGDHCRACQLAMEAADARGAYSDLFIDGGLRDRSET